MLIPPPMSLKILVEILHAVRMVLAIIIFVVEIIFLPIRFVFGTILTPIALKLQIGHVYALPCQILRFGYRGIVNWKTVHASVTNLPLPPPGQSPLCEEYVGSMRVFMMSSFKDVQTLASAYQFRQPTNAGPEVILIHGNILFVSMRNPTILSILISVKGWIEWNLFDPVQCKWRTT